MPYNYLGDLYKGEIVCRLQEMGYSIKNVHELNLILEKMGILEHCGNHWLTTEFGVKYTIYRGPVFDADAWHPSVIADISKYLEDRKSVV